MINNKSTIKAIIFDMGGVILDLTAKETLSIPKAISVMFDIPLDKAQEIWNGHDRTQLLTGKETPIEFLNNIANIVNTRKDTKTLLDEWTQLSRKENNCIDWKLLDYIRTLKKRFKVYVMSDAINIAQDDVLTREVKSRFDGYFVSYKEGYKKPEKNAFVNVLDKIKVHAKECVFVDDTISNIKSAIELEINAIAYTNLRQLKKDIIRYVG